MPPCFRGNDEHDLLFINDSQKGTKEKIFKDYAFWADHLAPADVGFQIGYETDQEWWEDYSNPPEDMGNELIDAHKNTAAIFWVDFTLKTVFDYL
jgi:hypothetical protein